MSDPILSPEFWRERLANARERHHAVFKCGLDHWRAIEAKHREILAAHIQPGDSILDAGCGWGRLLDLLPAAWQGSYAGVDLSPDFIRLAQKERPGRAFFVGDLRDLAAIPGAPWSWAIAISMRPMVRRSLGNEAWEQMEAQLRRSARRLLLLEYDPDDEGEVPA